MLSCVPPCLLGAARLPSPDPHFLWGSLAYPWLTCTLCSPAPAEMAGRFVLVAKDNPERERRHQCASALARGDLVVPLMYGRKLRAVARVVTVESEGMSLTQGCLCASVHTMN